MKSNLTQRAKSYMYIGTDKEQTYYTTIIVTVYLLLRIMYYVEQN